MWPNRWTQCCCCCRFVSWIADEIFKKCRTVWVGRRRVSTIAKSLGLDGNAPQPAFSPSTTLMATTTSCYCCWCHRVLGEFCFFLSCPAWSGPRDSRDGSWSLPDPLFLQLRLSDPIEEQNINGLFFFISFVQWNNPASSQTTFLLPDRIELMFFCFHFWRHFPVIQDWDDDLTIVCAYLSPTFNYWNLWRLIFLFSWILFDESVDALPIMSRWNPSLVCCVLCVWR